MGLLHIPLARNVQLFEQAFDSDPAACAAALEVSAFEDPVALHQANDTVLGMIVRDAFAEGPQTTSLSLTGAYGAEGQNLNVILESYFKGLQKQAAMAAKQDKATSRGAGSTATETQAKSLSMGNQYNNPMFGSGCLSCQSTYGSF